VSLYSNLNFTLEGYTYILKPPL